MILYTLAWIIFGCGMLGVYFTKYRGLPIEVYKPKAAWTHALIYFAFCNVVSAITGTLETLLNQPIITNEQLTNPMWVSFCLFCFIYIFFVYWILWARLTLTFDRKYYLGAEIVFGLLWGISTGQILLSFYHLWVMTSLPEWIIVICTFVCMGIWQYVIQDYFWDVRVSPEHDTPRSIMIKTILCHFPNIIICLLFLSIYNNYLIFVTTQTFALLASTIFQKFPAPWAKEKFHAPTIKPGLFGLPRGAGYQGE